MFQILSVDEIMVKFKESFSKSATYTVRSVRCVLIMQNHIKVCNKYLKN